MRRAQFYTTDVPASNGWYPIIVREWDDSDPDAPARVRRVCECIRKDHAEESVRAYQRGHDAAREEASR